jgi:hypothetical protein
MVHRRTWLKLLGVTSAAPLLELSGDPAVAAQPLDLEPTTLNTFESLALRYQTMYHSTRTRRRGHTWTGWACRKVAKSLPCRSQCHRLRLARSAST